MKYYECGAKSRSHLAGFKCVHKNAAVMLEASIMREPKMSA